MYYSAEEKIKMLEGWKQSGKSAYAYAKGIGVKQGTFAKWIKKEKEVKTGFVEIETRKITDTRNVPEMRIEKGDMKIYIPLNVSSNEISVLLKGLQTAI